MIDEKKLLEEFEKNITIRATVCGEEKEDIPFPPEGISNIVRNQPKIGKWIPCSEQLPEKGETVIACTLDGTFAGQFHEEGWYRENMFFYDSEILVREVIAWQPLPDPYQEQSCAGAKSSRVID